MSPRTALRRCPMCAALFGLMLVCSTITFEGSGVRNTLCLPAFPACVARKNAARSKKAFR